MADKNLLWRFFKQKTYSQILEECLEKVPDDLDKREGSVIFDALAPACWEIANLYDDLFSLLKETYGSTANKPYLDLRCAERGIFRLKALPAYRKIYFSKETSPGVFEPVTDIKCRTDDQQGLLLSTTNLDSNFTFEITEKYATLKATQAKTKKTFEDDSFIEATATSDYIGSSGNNLSFSILKNGDIFIVRTFKGNTVLFTEELELTDTFADISSNLAIKFNGEGLLREITNLKLTGGENKGVIKDGYYIGEASITGEIGNTFNDKIIPLENIRDAEATLLEVISYGRDEETDDSLRERYFDFLKKESFGGNIAQYVEWLKNIDGATEAPAGITGVQIYPVWNGGGTVKVSFVVDSDYSIPSDEMVSQVKEFLDPEIHTQKGIGIAPIGHNVTVVKPLRTAINLKVAIDFVEGSLILYKRLIQEAVEKYLLELRKEWDDLNKLANVYTLQVNHAKLVSDILNIEGIIDVNDNELYISKDLITWTNRNLLLLESASLQELPFVGEIEVSKIISNRRR